MSNSVQVTPVGEKMEEGEMDTVPEKEEEGGRDNALPAAVKTSMLGKVCLTLVASVEKDKSLDDARLEKHVPMSVLVPVWMLGKIVFLFVLAYLTVTTTQTDQMKKYLSPNYAFGTSSSYRLCELIPVAFSGTFLLDSSGYWQGTTAFQGGKAKYLVTFNDFRHTYKEYYEILSKMKADIALVASKASSSTISTNLLKFMSYAWVYVDGKVNHVLRFVADPADVFNKQFMRAALLSRLTPCGATPTISYDSTTGNVAVRYDIYSFASIFNPTANLKGCCTQGTLYTNIGNPETSAVEVSSTWGVAPTVDVSSSGPSDSRSFGFTTTAIGSTSGDLVVRFVYSGGALTAQALAAAVTNTLARLAVLAPGTASTSSLLLCSDPSDSSKCVIVKSTKLPTSTGCTVSLDGALGPSSPTLHLYLVDVSTITGADLASIKYSSLSVPPTTVDKMGGFKSVTTFPSATHNPFGYKGHLENLLGTGTTPNYLDTCLINPTNFGYDSNFDTSGFSLRYNVRSVITAVAVNNDQLPLAALQEVYTNLSIEGGCVLDSKLTLSGGVCQLTFNDDTYTIRTYIDPKYQQMDPIYCLVRTTSAQTSYTFTTMCLLRIGESYVYPYFNHMGLTASVGGPSDSIFYDPSQQCSCADATYDPNYLYPGTFGSNNFAYKITGSSSEIYCTVMDLMHGFVIMSDDLLSPGYSYASTNLAASVGVSTKPVQYKLLRYLQMASANTAADIAKYAYIAGFTALRVSYGIQVFDDPTVVEGWWDVYGNVLGGAGASPLQFCQGYPLGMNNAADGSAAVLAYSGVGGESSTTLQVLSSTANAVLQNGMTVTWTGSSGIVTLSGCSISVLTSAGTCTMSSARSLGAVFTASAMPTAGPSTTTLTITAVASGTVSNGMAISGTGITGTVTLSGCSISVLTSAGTCTMSLAQSFASQTITAAATVTGTFSAVFVATTNGGPSSTTLSVTSTQHDAIYNGGTITTTTTGVTGTVTLSNCQLDGDGTGKGTCTMSTPQSINAGTSLRVTNVAIFTASAVPQAGLSTTTLTITAVASGTVSNGMTISGTGITGTVTLSGCSAFNNGVRTCTMSLAQSFASQTITATITTSTAIGGSLSTLLTITSVTSGVVANGMRINLSGGSGGGLSFVTISGCSVSSATGTGTCTLSSGQIFSSSTLVGSPVDLSGNAYGKPDCTIYAMNTYDKSASVNHNHVPLLASHCNDEFSIPDSSWGRNTTWRYDTTEVPTSSNEQAGLGAFFEPPQNLVQSYYICYNKLTTSLSIAFGSAAGTAGIATGVAITLMVTLVTAGCFTPGGKEQKASGISRGAIYVAGAVSAGVGLEASRKG